MESKAKKRLIFRNLVDFIENEKTYAIALMAGIRRIGKSTILRQLKERYQTAELIDFSVDIDAEDRLKTFIMKPSSKILLLDEITRLPNYEYWSEELFNNNCDEDGTGWEYKVIITGSSPAHLCNLANTKLGGGRSQLFYLPVLTFVEYLYFTNRIASYTEYNSATVNDFKDYLQLKNLNPLLAVSFDKNYFINYYNDVDGGNDCGYSNQSQVDIEQEDLIALADILAYQLAEDVSYKRMELGKATIGKRELGYEFTEKGYKLLDFSKTILFADFSKWKKLSEKSRARIIKFLLKSRIANIETLIDSEDVHSLSERKIIDLLDSTSAKEDLVRFFSKVTIAINSPLLYTRIGTDLLTNVGLSWGTIWENSKNNSLMGQIVEVYIRGALSQYNNPLLAFRSEKLNFPGIGEVDIHNEEHKILCEVATGNKVKAMNDVRVASYYMNMPYIRLYTTQNHEDFINGIHRIPYPKLCCMIDTGDILKLERTIVDSEFTNSSKF